MHRRITTNCATAKVISRIIATNVPKFRQTLSQAGARRSYCEPAENQLYIGPQRLTYRRPHEHVSINRRKSIEWHGPFFNHKFLSSWTGLAEWDQYTRSALIAYTCPQWSESWQIGSLNLKNLPVIMLISRNKLFEKTKARCTAPTNISPNPSVSMTW